MSIPTTQIVRCQLCGKGILWNRPTPNATTPPKWCKAHENRAKRARSLCPTPSKERHSTKDAALSSAAYANRKRGTSLRVYECKCTYWHLTSRVG